MDTHSTLCVVFVILGGFPLGWTSPYAFVVDPDLVQRMFPLGEDWDSECLGAWRGEH